MPEVAEASSQLANASEVRRNARLYLLGMTASFVGGSAMTLAAGIWVKALTGSSSLAAVVSVCVYAPVWLAPFAGLLADRVPRRALVVWANAGVAVAMMPLLLVRSDEQLWLILVSMTCYGIALTLIDPAEQALFTVMLPLDERRRLNGVRMSVQEGGKVIAPLAGAGAYAALGGGVVGVATALAFAVAAVSTRLLRVDEPPIERSGNWHSELAGGFRHVWHQRSLLCATASAAVAMFAAGTLVGAQFSLVDALHRPPSFLGVITGLLGAGSIVAGLVSAGIVRRFGESRLLMLGLGNGVVGYLLMASGHLPTVLAGAVITGFVLPWIVIAVVNLAQRLSPVALQGRVASATTLALFATQPVAQLVGASLIAVVDFWLLYITAATTSAVNLVVVALVRRQVRPNAYQRT